MKANQKQIIYSVIEGIMKEIVQALPDMISAALSNFRLSPEILTKSNLSNFVR